MKIVPNSNNKRAKRKEKITIMLPNRMHEKRVSMEGRVVVTSRQNSKQWPKAKEICFTDVINDKSKS